MRVEMDKIETEALNRMGIDWMEFLLMKVEVRMEMEEEKNVS
jgi:hypothetical protein